MNGILGMAQLLLRPGLSEAQRQGYVQTILKSGRLLLGLLSDILDFSRSRPASSSCPGAPRTSPACWPSGGSSRQAASKGLAFEVVAWRGPAGLCCLADRQRLVQMLSNLVGNAVKFSTTGSIRVEGRQVGVADGLVELGSR